eukprot:5880299-Pleurochrysis_carterae.AAC.1
MSLPRLEASAAKMPKLMRSTSRVAASSGLSSSPSTKLVASALVVSSEFGSLCCQSQNARAGHTAWSGRRCGRRLHE